MSTPLSSSQNTPFTTLPPAGAAAKRRFRNYLLDPRFQLKYAGMVVAVAFAISSVLGYFVWSQSKGLSESAAAANVAAIARMPDDASPEQLANFETAVKRIERDAAELDRNILIAIVLGITFITFALGITGVFVTHRLVGPAYKLRLLMKEVALGRLKVAGRLRHGDELQDVFKAFEKMINALRARQVLEIETLERALANARTAGTPQEVIADLESLVADMKSELGE